MKSLASLAAALAATLTTGAIAQAPTQYGCDSPESRELDFWVGDWELSYSAGGKAMKSRNRITKVLGGCVILEEFAGGEGTRLEGRSFSTYDRATRQWRQTWVDNTASYLDFHAGRVDGDMAFVREATSAAGKKAWQRMVFRDVKPDSLKWLWQSSPDGAAWTTQWEIDYRRVK